MKAKCKSFLRGDWTSLLLLAGILLFVSCKPSEGPVRSSSAPARSQLGKQVVAAVGNDAILRQEFEAQWEQRNATGSREELLSEMIRQRALVQAAIGGGYEQNAALKQRFERMLAAAFLEDKLTPLLQQAGEVGEPEIAAHYEQHAVEFAVQEQIRAGVIFIRAASKMDADKRTALREQAERLQAEAASADAEGFRLLVQKNSEHQPTRYCSGDAGWLERNSKQIWNPSVIESGFGLAKPGAVAPLVDVPEGFFVVRLLERKPAGRQQLSTVADVIRHRLSIQKRQACEEAFYRNLLSGISVQTNLQVLGSIEASARKVTSMPPDLPGR